MKIAVWHNLPSGGAKRALHDQVRGLTHRGFAVKAFVPPTAEEGFLPLRDLCPVEVVPLADKSARRSVVGMAEAALKGPRRFYEAMSEHAAQVGNRVVEEGFEIVLAGGCRQFFAPVLPHGIRGVHTVLYLQEPNRPLYEVLPGAKPMSAQDAEWMRTRERENAARCARILCNSKFSRESILRAYGIDPYVCYLGIDLEKFHPGTLPSKPQVVCVGSLIPAKRPEFVVETVGLLPLPRPKVLWIGNAQDPGYRAHIEELAKKRGVELEVRILVTDDELVRELQTSRATVYAPRLEPFGYGPLEANACGVPVVGLAEGGVRESVAEGRSGFLVDTLSDAADALHRILTAPESLRDSARTWAEEWSMDRAIDRLVGHLGEVESADFEWIGPLERRERRRSSILTEHPEGE